MGKFDVDYGINFKVNKTDLDALKRDLISIKSLTAEDFMTMNKGINLNQAKKELAEIKNYSGQIQIALNNAFNADLGVINIHKLSSEIRKLPIKDIYTSFQKAGAAGVAAFNSISSSVLKGNLQLKESHALLDKIGTTFANTVRFGLASSVFNRMTDSIQRSWEFTKQLDTSLNDIRIVTGKSADEMERFAKTANTAVQKLGATTQDYTKASLIYYQQGLDDEETQARADVTVKTANVTGQQASKVSEQLTAIWNGYKVQASEAELYIDKVAKVAATTAADLGEMATGMSKVASAANSAGVDIDQLNAMLATVISVTREAPETIGTSFRTIFARLGDLKMGGTDEDGLGLGQIAKKVNEFGINILDKSGDLREMGDIITEIAGKWDNLSRGERQALAIAAAGKQQYSRFIALFDNWDMYTKALEDSRTASGELQKQQDIYMESTEAHLNKLTAAQERVGKAFVDNKGINSIVDGITAATNGLANFIEALGGGGKFLLNLGAIGTTVFNKQIASGINSVINNMQVAQQNARALKQQLDDLKWMQSEIGGPGKDLGLDAKVQARERIQIYAKSLSPQQIDQGNMLADDLGNAISQKQQYENNYNKVLETANSVLGRTDITNIHQQLLDGSAAAEAFNQKLESTKNDCNDLTAALDEVKNAADKYREAQVNAGNATEKNAEAMEKQRDVSYQYLLQTLDSISNNSNFLIDSDFVKGLDPKIKAELKKDINELKSILDTELTQTSKGNDGPLTELLGSDAAWTRKFNGLIDKIKSFAKAANIEIKNIDNVIKTEDKTQGKQKEHNETIVQDKTQNLNDFLGEQERQVLIQDLVKITGGVTSLISAWNTLSNIPAIWNDENLTSAQKCLQTIMALSSGFGMLAMSFNNISNSAKSITTIFNVLRTNIAKENIGLAIKNQLLKEGYTLEQATAIAEGQLAVMTNLSAKATWREVAALIAKKALLAIGIVAAIGAVIGVTYLLVQAYNADAEAARLTAQAAQEAADAYEDCANKAKALKETISDYEAGKNELKDLKKGTEEYTQALEDANKKAKELVETYGLYDQVEMKDGLLTFKDGVLEDLQSRVDSAMNAAEELKYSTKIAANNASLNSQRTNLSRDVGSVIDPLKVLDNVTDPLNSFNDTIQLTNEEVEKIINTLGTIKETRQDEYLRITKSNEAFTEWIKTTNDGDRRFQLLAETIGKSKDAFVALTDKTLELTKANEYYIAQMNAASIKEQYGSQITQMSTNAKTGEVDTARYNQIVDIINNSAPQNKVREQKKVINDVASQYWDEGYGRWYLGHEFPSFNNKNKEVDETVRQLGLNTNLYGGDIGSSDENLARKYAKYIKNMTDEEINNLVFKSKKLVDSSGNTVIDSSNKEQRTEQRVQLVKYALNQGYGAEYEDQSKPATISFIDNLNQGQYNAAVVGAKYGTDFSQALLNAISSKTKEFDLSGLFNRIDPDEYAELTSLDTNQLMTLFNFSEEDIKQMGFESGQQFADNFKAGLKNYKWNIDDALNESMNLKQEEIEANGNDLSKKKFAEYQEDVKVYAKNLMQIAESEKDVGDGLKYDSDTAVDFALKVIKMNKAIDTLADNFKDWKDILKKSSKTSQEYAEAMFNIKDALADVYDTSADYISHDFIDKHLSQIEKIATGDEKAIEALRDELSEDIVGNILIENKIANRDEILGKFKSLREQAQAEMDGLAIGDNIQVDDANFVNSLNKLIEDSQMTVEQANAVFSALGVEPTYATETVMQEQSNPIIQTDTYTSETQGKKLEYIGPDGEKHTTKIPNFSQIQTSRTIGYTKDTVEVPVTAIAANGKQPKISGIKKAPTGSFNNYSSSNKGGGGPGKSSKSGGGSKAKPDKMDKVESKPDRYHKVNAQLDKIGHQLDKIQSQEKKFIGTKLIDNLNGQLAKLDNRIDNLREKQKIAYGEANELKNKLATGGVTFNDDGTINNYMEMYNSKLNYVNGLIDKYNGMSKDEQEKFKDTVEQAKKDFDKWQEDMDRYDELISDTIPGLTNDIQDAIDEEIELNIKKFNLEFEVKLDIADAQKDWNEFKRKILDDIDDDDILGNARARATDDLGVYLSGTDGKDGLLGAGVKQTQSILKELKDMDEKGWSNVYGDNRVSALEDLQEAYQNVEQSLIEIKEIQEDVAQAVLDQMDAVVDAMDKVADLMDTVDSQIEHDIKVIEMVYGETDYDAKGKYMEQRQKNNLDTLGTAKENRDYWEQQMNLIDDKTSEAYQKAQENFFKYNDAVNDAIEKSIEDAQEKAENAIDGIFKKYNDEITNGKGLDYTEQQWELVNDVADQYLDTVNAAFGIRQLEGKWKDAIDQTDNIGAQKKLNTLMEEQLKKLREKDKLTEYDIERAEKEYEIALKKLALEEAQQTKSTMRLRRDSQGNYRYEYVADENQIAKLQDELDALENSLYNFDKERWLEMQNQVIDAVRDRQDAIKEILMDASLTEEERLERLEEINKLYNEKIQNITDQAVTAQTNLYDSGATELAKIWDEQGKDFQNLSDEEQRILVEEMLPQFETGVNEMIDKFSGPGGFEDTTTNSMNALSQATQDYQNDLDDVENQAGITFDEIRNGQDDVLDRMPDMINDAEDYVEVMQDELSELQDINEELKKKLDYYKQIQIEAKKAATEAYNYWLKEQQIAAEKYAQENAKNNNNAGGNNGNTGNNNSGSGNNGGKTTLSAYDAVGVAAAISLGSNYGGWGVGKDRSNKLAAKFTNDNDVQAVINRNNGYKNSRGEFNAYKDKLSNYYYDRFNTGGYTGDWAGDYGKFAMLDRKELVLNADDTENMLDMLSITRDVVAAAGPRGLGSRLMIPQGEASALEQNVHIEATFPGVEDAAEIKQALNDLVNMAAQRANRNTRG